MQVTYSQKERGCLFEVLEAGNSWGGSEVALLARDDLYDALKLAEFEGAKHEVRKLSDTQKKYEVPRAAGEELIAAITAGQVGLGRIFGRVLAPAVRRTRAALDASKPKEKAPGAAP